MGSPAPAAARATRARHRRQDSRPLDRDEGLRLASTQPPPPMPAMSPRRDDSPRSCTRPGANSRYWRARRERTIADDLADISAYLDSIHAHERLEGLQAVQL